MPPRSRGRTESWPDGKRHSIALVYVHNIQLELVGPLDDLRTCTAFEWDDGNSGKNREKQQVSDGECEQVFFNQPLVAVDDDEHSWKEERILVLGKTDPGRRLFIVCTVRDNLIRVISAREMTKKEREVYFSYG